MAQQENLAVIDLEPLGGRKVSAEELGQTVKNIIEQVQSLGKGSSAEAADTTNDESGLPAAPKVNSAELKKYAIYAGSGLLGLWLIRKAIKG